MFFFIDPEFGEYMPLENRIKKIYLNYSICDSNCEYEGINNQKNTISCICSSGLNIESKIEDPKFKKKTLTYLQISDIGFLKCYNLLNKKMLKTFPFWMSMISLIIRLFLYFIYFKSGINPIKNYVEKEMIKYHYDIEESEIKKEIRNSICNSNQNSINLNSERINIKKAGTFPKNKPEKKNVIIIYHRPLDNNEDKKDKNRIYNSQINNFNNENIEIKKNDENEVIKNENKIYSIKEVYTLISLDANNTSENREPKDSNLILDNYYYDLALKYEKRSLSKIILIINLNTDFFYVVLFNSSLYLKSLCLVLILRTLNDEIIFNALLNYDDTKNVTLYFIINFLIMPFASTIISKLLSFIYGKLIDCKDDLKDLFIEEEKKMRKSPNYKVEKSKKIEIKKKFAKFLNL